MNKHIVGKVAPPRKAPDARTLATVSAAAEGTRLQILLLLGSEGPRCVGDIASRFRSSRPAISHHLRVLKGCDLVAAERRGQEICYSLQRERLVSTLRGFADALENCCAPARSRR